MLITCVHKPSLNVHADLSCGDGGLNIGFKHHLHPYLLYCGREGSGKVVVMG